ncbi:hypothetical protein BKA83DRAFT_4177868, partial [Pisolithus microcarpus]
MDDARSRLYWASCSLGQGGSKDLHRHRLFGASASAASVSLPAHPLGGSRPFYGICYPLWSPFHTPGAVSILRWGPGAWPPMLWPTDVPVRLAPWLVPSPVNPCVPQLEWDMSRHPLTARHVTGAHVTIPLDSAGGGVRAMGALVREWTTSR